MHSILKNTQPPSVALHLLCRIILPSISTFSWVCLKIGDTKKLFGHGSKPRTPSEHPNPHSNRLKWVVHLPQNGIPFVLTHSHLIFNSFPSKPQSDRKASPFPGLRVELHGEPWLLLDARPPQARVFPFACASFQPKPKKWRPRKDTAARHSRQQPQNEIAFLLLSLLAQPQKNNGSLYKHTHNRTCGHGSKSPYLQ